MSRPKMTTGQRLAAKIEVMFSNGFPTSKEARRVIAEMIDVEIVKKLLPLKETIELLSDGTGARVLARENRMLRSQLRKIRRQAQ